MTGAVTGGTDYVKHTAVPLSLCIKINSDQSLSHSLSVRLSL
jgi:hypothetical protein